MTATTESPNNLPIRKSRWIPWVFVGLFGVFLTANVIMIYIAATTWTGLTAKSAYRQGIEYNQTLDKRAAARKLGWQIAVGFKGSAGVSGVLSVRITDKKGAPLDGARIRGSAFRPVAQGHDFAFSGFESRGNGLHAARTSFPVPGLWEVRLKIEHQGRTIDASHRIRIERPAQ